ncbi:hypothetical protein [Brevundimonas sp.]|uniref:hypothetical protein n=1 Tax=Brevundimonas sp. TaxID=1871086 RepID=UPI0025BFFEEF|nr:hypothetical protein [Brevundimonas sp.]
MRLISGGAAVLCMFALAACDAREPAPKPEASAPLVTEMIAPPRPEAVVISIPLAFRGAWATDLAECTADESTGKMSLTIGGRAITYSETSDALISVNEIGPESVRLTVDHDNDGEVRRLERTLTLSNDRQTLSFNYGDEPQVVIRCPQG